MPQLSSLTAEGIIKILISRTVQLCWCPLTPYWYIRLYLLMNSLVSVVSIIYVKVSYTIMLKLLKSCQHGSADSAVGPD